MCNPLALLAFSFTLCSGFAVPQRLDIKRMGSFSAFRNLITQTVASYIAKPTVCSYLTILAFCLSAPSS